MRSTFSAQPPNSLKVCSHSPPIKTVGDSVRSGGAIVSELPENPSVGELLVRNGKQRGVRLPLRHPLTLIGSGDGCDIRLTAEGVGAIHCAIILTPGGPALRSVGDAESLVNG